MATSNSIEKHRAAVKKYQTTEKYRNCRREREYQRRYDISLEQYNQMLEAQGGVCAICGGVESTRNKWGIRPLSVDHCHATGTVRKLLCNNCNQVIGKAKESVEILEKAIQYLKEN